MLWLLIFAFWRGFGGMARRIFACHYLLKNLPDYDKLESSRARQARDGSEECRPAMHRVMLGPTGLDFAGQITKEFMRTTDSDELALLPACVSFGGSLSVADTPRLPSPRVVPIRSNSAVSKKW